MKTLKRITIMLAVVGLFVALELADNKEATSKEIFTAAIMGVVSVSTIITLSINKEDYGTSKN